MKKSQRAERELKEFIEKFLPAGKLSMGMVKNGFMKKMASHLRLFINFRTSFSNILTEQGRI